MENSKILSFPYTSKLHFSTKFSVGTHQFSLSTATKITCTIPFHRLFAAVSPHCNFDFPQKPILQRRFAALWCTFWLLFRTSEKVTENRPFYAFHKTKSTLSMLFRKRKALPKCLFGYFSQKVTRPPAAPSRGGKLTLPRENRNSVLLRKIGKDNLLSFPEFCVVLL